MEKNSIGGNLEIRKNTTGSQIAAINFKLSGKILNIMCLKSPERPSILSFENKFLVSLGVKQNFF